MLQYTCTRSSAADCPLQKWHATYTQRGVQKMGTLLLKSTSTEKSLQKEYNLGFHIPKKDQCATCAQFNNLEGAEKDAFQPEHDLHLERKEEAESERRRQKNTRKKMTTTRQSESLLI